MNKTRFTRTAPLDILGAVLTACSFCALWLLWPVSSGVQHSGTRAFRGTRFVFRPTPADNSRDPTQLVRPFLGSGGISSEDFDDREAMTPGRADMAKLLERPSSPKVAGAGFDLLDDALEQGVSAYVDIPAFARVPTAAAGRVRVGVAGDLLAREFNAAILSNTVLPLQEQAWVARAFVEVDEYGTVTQVHLETPTANTELNAAILRGLYGSCASRKASRKGQTCDGIVTITGVGKGPGEKTR